MKFDFCIGNPPYQETKGGTKNVDIWPLFIECANNISEVSSMIHPGRWVNPKKQMMNTHNSLIKSGLVGFRYYPNSSRVFNGVNIDGGVTITMFKKGYHDVINYYINDIPKGVFNLFEASDATS